MEVEVGSYMLSCIWWPKKPYIPGHVVFYHIVSSPVSARLFKLLDPLHWQLYFPVSLYKDPSPFPYRHISRVSFSIISYWTVIVGNSPIHSLLTKHSTRQSCGSTSQVWNAFVSPLEPKPSSLLEASRIDCCNSLRWCSQTEISFCWVWSQQAQWSRSSGLEWKENCSPGGWDEIPCCLVYLKLGWRKCWFSTFT